jgi:catechol 2,3-dioxygenase-like lactoylglutathione lyase family enzyme
MAAVGLNHVSVCAPDIEASIAFYADLFGAERLPTPNFGYPVQWLRVGDLQVHLFDRPEPARKYAHFGLTVDDMNATYEKARELGALDFGNFGHCLFELPGDCVQLYLRDPGGNLVEADAQGVDRLSPSVRADLQPLTDHCPQNEENLRATLFLSGRA